MRQSFVHTFPFELECGRVLEQIEIAYHSYGELNAARDNVIWACHALTGSSELESWWSDLMGKGNLFDPSKHFIVCANMLGSCYGSTYALSKRPSTGIPYYYDFPIITNRDIVRGFDLLRKHLGIEKIHLLTGGSMGGQQVLEWAIMEPSVIDNLVPIATNAQHSPWGIAFNEAQRMAIEADATWGGKYKEAGLEGMKAARAMGMISYRHYDTFGQTQKEQSNAEYQDFRAASYQKYQGKKLADRFDAFAYYTLSKGMDSQNVGRSRAGIEEALAGIQAKTLAVGVSSDILFPKRESKFIAKHIPGAQYGEIDSIYGHDAFLIEYEQLRKLIQDFLGQ